MLTNVRTVRIEWGDCDPAGIVFYPRFFAMFDASTTALFERALGMTKYKFIEHYGIVGYPMVESSMVRFSEVLRRYGSAAVMFWVNYGSQPIRMVNLTTTTFIQRLSTAVCRSSERR